MISPLCSKTPPQVVFAIEVTGCDAFMSEERVKACLGQLQIALKNLSDLDLKRSWTQPSLIQDATQDQTGLGQSSSPNLK